MIYHNLENSYLFILIPILIGILIFNTHRNKKKLNILINTAMWSSVIDSLSYQRRFWKSVCLVIGLSFIIFTLLRPQYGAKYDLLERKGLDIMIAVDTSFSMNAEDVTPSRFERAKQEIRTLVDNLKGDRIGLTAFSGNAFVHSPLTLDYSAIKLFLEDIHVGMIPRPGTNLKKAIEVSQGAFNQKEKKFKVLVLFTDGEHLEGELEKIAATAKKQGITIYPVGIGAPGGEPIPIKDESGAIIEYKKDKEGEIVLSKLDEETLKQFAEKTGGHYYHSTQNQPVSEKLYRDISQLEKKQLEEKLFKQFKDRYQLFLVIAFLFLLFEFCFPERKHA